MAAPPNVGEPPKVACCCGCCSGCPKTGDCPKTGLPPKAGEAAPKAGEAAAAGAAGLPKRLPPGLGVLAPKRLALPAELFCKAALRLLLKLKLGDEAGCCC